MKIAGSQLNAILVTSFCHHVNKINVIPCTSSHRKTWLLIHSLQNLWTSIFYRQRPIWSSPLFVFFQTPHFRQYLCGNIVQMKYIQNKNTKHLQEKVISANQHYSITGWYLIQNNNNLRYHKDLKEKQVSLHWTPIIRKSKI